MNELLDTPTGAGKTCTGGHRFVWQSPNYAMQYSVPHGLRCMCGAMAFDDLVDEAVRCGVIKDVKPPTYTEFRSDGWPLCPGCGQDELWSDIWNRLEPKPSTAEFIANIQGCYACGWKPSSPIGALSEQIAGGHIETLGAGEG